jgi:uncharacterized Tic20 family protein
MNDLVPFKFRMIATILHSIFAIPMGLNVVFYLWLVFIEGRSMSNGKNLVMTVVFYFFFISLPTILLWPIISWGTWQITRAIDPFVDLAGRDVFNYTLSNLATTLCLTVVLVVISGILYKVKYFHEVSLTILVLVVAVFVMTSIVAGIFSFRGYRFSNILIHPFLHDR